MIDDLRASARRPGRGRDGARQAERRDRAAPRRGTAISGRCRPARLRAIARWRGPATRLKIDAGDAALPGRGGRSPRPAPRPTRPGRSHRPPAPPASRSARRELGGRAGLAVGRAVEQPHDAFARHEVGAARAGDQPGERRRPHRPGVEVDAGRAAGQRVKASGRYSRARPWRRRPASPRRRKCAQERQGHQGLAAARGGRGDDQPAARASAPDARYQVEQSRRSRTTSPMTMIAGGSMPLARLRRRRRRRASSPARAAPAVVALLTIAAGSSRPRPAAISRVGDRAEMLQRHIQHDDRRARARSPSQSTRVRHGAAASCPVTKVTAELMSRWVTGMPA